ncbi:hypothetical protein V1477_016666 [Vespula maculifrons]|uniref:Uncharacterized protein n=1 Tax=Vespula maculifrons TaxID=7453 RepID=A0ABD2B3W3_VESMC
MIFHNGGVTKKLELGSTKKEKLSKTEQSDKTGHYTRLPYTKQMCVIDYNFNIAVDKTDMDLKSIVLEYKTKYCSALQTDNFEWHYKRLEKLISEIKSKSKEHYY